MQPYTFCRMSLSTLPSWWVFRQRQDFSWRNHDRPLFGFKFQPFDCRWCAQYVPNIFFDVLGCEWNVQLHVPILSDELTLQFNSQLEIHIFLGEKPQFLRLKSTFLQVGIPIFAGPFRSTFAPTPEICRFADDGLGRRSAGSHPQLWQKWIVWNMPKWKSA